MSFSFPTPHSEKLHLVTPLRATVGAAAACLALESVATYRDTRRLDDRATMVSTRHDGDTSIYVLPGCRTDGHFLARTFEPHFQGIGSTNFVAYPQKGFSIDAVRDTILEARAGDDERPASFYVLSMGGIVLSTLLKDAEFRDKVGDIDMVLFDSSPTGAHTLSEYTHKAMEVAAHTPPIRAVSHAYKHFMKRRTQHIDADLPYADVLREHLATTAETPLNAVKGQTQLIRSARFGSGELQPAGAAINHMAYITALSDDVVDVERAHAEYELMYSRPIDYIVDETRSAPSHAAGPEHWQKVAELLADRQPAEAYEYPFAA